MKMELSGVFPVKTYLLKFVQKVENLEDDEPLTITDNGGIIPMTLYLFLTNKNNILNEQYSPNKRIDDNYPSKLRFRISTRMRKFNRLFFLKRSIPAFNKLLRSFMLEYLLQRILLEVKEGKTQKKVIYDFMREFEIEEDTDYETLKKAIFRLKKDKNIQVLSTNPSPGVNELCNS